MTTGRPTLDDVRRSLYGGSRTTFVERRKELAAAARRGGDRDEATLIGAMRKPTAAAHLVNLVALADDTSLHELVELGVQIRRAMADGDDRAMRSLLKGRVSAIADTMARATALARANGESVSGVVGDQIVQTLRAAMASDEAAAAVRSGSLTEALDEPGFGDFSIELPARAPSPRSPAKGKPPSKADDGIARAAEVRRVEEALAAATKRLDMLQSDRDRIAAELARIDEELDAARAEAEDLEHQLRDAAAELETASEAAPR